MRRIHLTTHVRTALLAVAFTVGAPGLASVHEGRAAFDGDVVPIAVLTAEAQQAGAEMRPRHPEAEEAISRLKSPWCPGLMLEVCPSYPAAAFRDTLRMMAEDGVMADSLVAWALARHGEHWSAVPGTSGTDLLAWIIPPIFLLFGAGAVVLALRRLRRGPDAPVARDDREISEEEERRIQEALRDLERT